MDIVYKIIGIIVFWGVVGLLIAICHDWVKDIQRNRKSKD